MPLLDLKLKDSLPLILLFLYEGLNQISVESPAKPPKSTVIGSSLFVKAFGVLVSAKITQIRQDKTNSNVKIKLILYCQMLNLYRIIILAFKYIYAI